MNIQLPDKFYKFLVFLSFILIVFIYLKSGEDSKREINSILHRNSLIDSLELNKLKEKQLRENLIDESEIISTRNNIRNPISYSKDSLITFNRIITSKNKKEIEINDLINLRWKNFQNFENKNLLLAKQIDQANEDNEIATKLFEDEFFWLLVLLSIISGMLLFEGIKSWYKQEQLITNTFKDKNLIVYQRCQSCFKKFSSIRNYSQNADNTVNYAFCEDCYQNGNFTEKYKTIDDLYNELTNNRSLKENEVKYLKHKICKLDRWKKNEY
ncbi:Putative zinc ribbon domain-containing protein [Halpernia humi]|uniref:Putative zinc ribbon domain-containing protein n=1 Tax=Halpernia humi TaxID=493375 RepID=A0A1H6BKD2_9FLAO|nr:zinc ribbon domain-containing protein [Halpernia humi]SEG61150.1 Putative zinc ribbon domain-containing protein [Halpernia humi]